MPELEYLRPSDNGCLELVVTKEGHPPIVRQLTDKKLMQWLSQMHTHLDMRLREIGFYEGDMDLT